MLCTTGALRVAYLLDVFGSPILSEYWVLDSKEYLAQAGQLPGGVFQFSPFYWAVLGLLSVPGVLVLQVLCGIATTTLVYGLTLRAFGRVAAAIAAAMYGLYPAAALLDVKLLPTSFGTFFLLAGLALLWSRHATRRRPSQWVLAGSGLCFGLSSLCQPSHLLTFAGLVAWWTIGRRGTEGDLLRETLQGAALLSSCAVLCLLPSTLHNYERSGAFILVSGQGGVTFYQGNNPRAEGAYSTPVEFSGSKEHQQLEARENAEKAKGPGLDDGRVSAYFGQRGLEYLRSDLGHTAWLLWRKARYWMGSAELASEYTLSVERRLSGVIRLFVVPFGWIVGLAFSSAFPLLSKRLAWERVAPLLVVVGFNLLSTLLFFFASRYRAPAVAALSVLAGAGAADLLQRWRKSSSPTRFLFAVPSVVVCLLSLSVGREAESLQAAAQLYNFGNEAFEREKFEQAVRLYESAAETRRKTPDLFFNLGQARAKMGDRQGAREAWERVLELDPNDEAARHLIEQMERRP